MRNLLLGAVAVGLTLLVGSPAAAQDTCSDVLKPGTDMSVRFHQTDQFQQALYQRFRSMTFQQSLRETGLGLSVPIGEAVMGSGDYSEASFNLRKEQIDNLYATQTHRFRSIDYELDAHDPEVLAAWRECMGHQARLIIWFNRPTATQATMTLDWLNANTSQTEVRLTQDVNLRDGVRAAPSNCLNAGHIYSVGRPCTVDLELRAADTSALISANTTNGSAQAYLPPRQRLVPHRDVWNPLPTAECQGPPPGVGTDANEPWRAWGRRCLARAITDIKRNSTKGNAIVELPPELRAGNWRFDTDPSVIPHVAVLRHWGDRGSCPASTEPVVTASTVSYSFDVVSAGNANATMVCSAFPSPFPIVRETLEGY